MNNRERQFEDLTVEGVICSKAEWINNYKQNDIIAVEAFKKIKNIFSSFHPTKYIFRVKTCI